MAEDTEVEVEETETTFRSQIWKHEAMVEWIESERGVDLSECSPAEVIAYAFADRVAWRRSEAYAELVEAHRVEQEQEREAKEAAKAKAKAAREAERKAKAEAAAKAKAEKEAEEAEGKKATKASKPATKATKATKARKATKATATEEDPFD